ncbi:MAG: TrkA family potassium uptake protein [Chloroflexi bacterium]|nr:TrkA family potassium uptake protein [Chloroflexota bacterium]
MKMIIIGCGRMGAGLAQILNLRGHAVTVVDRDSASFERLVPSFKGQSIAGNGMDRDILLGAGIERADGMAVLTASDEANVAIARLASQVFRVPRVVARLYDPRKADIYQRLGLQTIAPITWGANHIADLLCYSPLDSVMILGNGEVNVVAVEIPSLLVGRTARELTVSGEIHVMAITRAGKSFLPTLGTVFQKDDLVHLVVLAASSNRLRALLGLA